MAAFLGKQNEPHPEYLKLLQAGPPPLPPKDISLLRLGQAGGIKQRDASAGPVTEVFPVKIDDIKIPVRDGTEIPAQAVAPVKANGPLPLVVMFHGGGFCLGEHTDDIQLHSKLASELGIVILSVGYRLAPEAPFPTGVNDAWDATKWGYRNAASLGADHAAGLIVGGVSAGANLACIVGYENRDAGNPVPITGLFLSVPPLCPSHVLQPKYANDYLSQEQNRGLSPPPDELVVVFMDALKPDFSSPLYVPLNHPDGLGGLPPVYFQVCGLDPLRDEALILERELREDHKISTKVDFYPGLPHAFWEFFPTLEEPIKKWTDDTTTGFKWLLRSE
ncbi:Alpha/Beta hydrolase protein [Ilyonectria robusta]|uniref:Alpha/Beta hydrolase protein n=1 Tax=Ilyonectria robusta TaxID=1079257 RepID=UPI001E8E9C24|nr:Alpha/Beta hydrolase protein [Ilyonectria robusta]KAH8663224.1 Alpha/Beta hydrolase protein [Ilyonectria robusta]